MRKEVTETYIKSRFKHCTNYNKNLIAVALENKMIKFDKPIYIGKYTFLNYIFIIYYHIINLKDLRC